MFVICFIGNVHVENHTENLFETKIDLRYFVSSDFFLKWLGRIMIFLDQYYPLRNIGTGLIAKRRQ